MKFPDRGLGDKSAALGPVAPGGDDWLSRANNAIVNFKEMLRMVAEIRGLKPGQGNPAQAKPAPGAQSRDANPPRDPKDIIEPLMKVYGNKTVGELIKVISPLTLNQIRENIRRAGFG